VNIILRRIKWLRRDLWRVAPQVGARSCASDDRSEAVFVLLIAPRWLFAALLIALAAGRPSPASQGDAQHWLTAAGQHSGLTADGSVHSFPLPHARSGPTTVSIARDGRVWFTESTGDRIGRMNPDGSGLVEFALPNPASAPRIIAVGADGDLWFSEHTGNRIGRASPDGKIVEFEIPTPASQPRAIALGADGNIWFGMFAAGRIGRITPTGAITEFTVPTALSGPRALAAGPDGNIWFSEYRTDKIGRITPRGAVTEFELPRPNSGPGDITAGADGAMWFVELSGGMDGLVTNGNHVGRITMAGAVTEFEIPMPGPSPINIAVGPDRDVWYTRGSRLGRVTASGQITEFPLGAAARAVGLTAGSDRQPPSRLVNRLWFADAGQNEISYLEFR
jgi:virginiamycin B lyase